MMTLATPPLTDSTRRTVLQGNHSRVGEARGRQGQILFLMPVGDNRLGESLPARVLHKLGYQAAVAGEISPATVRTYDLVIARRPHSSRETMESLAACTAAGIPAILDLELDFKHMPYDHPDYQRYGLCTPGRIRSYEVSLQMVKTIRVPSETFGESLRFAGQQVQVIPEGWSRSNDLWSKPAAARHTFNIGWVGSPGGLEDLLEVRRILVRVLREFPHARIVLSGDPQALQLFDTLPEGRYQYLPTPNPEDYPYLLSQMDLLIAPLRSIPFHKHSCDQRLMEAGVRSIPWVASPAPAFIQWGAGGLIACTPEEWHTNLRQLILDPEMRFTLGQAGYQRAQGREMNQLGQAWLELVETALDGKTPSPSNWATQ